MTAVDAAARTVRIDAAPYVLTYDTLVYALGSTADTTTVPGAATHASTVATHQDAVLLRARAQEARGALAVVGGGLTGIEAAAELAEARPGRTVHLVTQGEIGPGLSERGRRYLRGALRRHGVTLHEHTRVGEVTAHGLALADGGGVAADAVVWAAGFRVPDLAREAGLAVDDRGLITVGPDLRSLSHPEVFAAGDAVAAYGPDGSASRMSCQTGLPMGARAARNVAAALTGRTPNRSDSATSARTSASAATTASPSSPAPTTARCPPSSPAAPRPASRRPSRGGRYWPCAGEAGRRTRRGRRDGPGAPAPATFRGGGRRPFDMALGADGPRCGVLH
ncbi:NAD(P)/FAD-dependent oxidoreductase [Streptomyces sp. Ac-502]|uniref:NAD(P)/FAD-dependent oxidoreductase n=1 Tax=Streptomyces sp. Ac-502 TaxID=3342801 RepID=UPI003862B8E3